MRTLLPWLEASMLIETEACIQWPFGKNKGYGQFRMDGKTCSAPRYVCAKAHGGPPAGKPECRHLCGTPGCINRRHRAWGSHRENMQDKLLHGTHQIGERNHRAKLSLQSVLEIRDLEPYGLLPEIASRYGVSKGTVTGIWRGDRWAKAA